MCDPHPCEVPEDCDANIQTCYSGLRRNALVIRRHPESYRIDMALLKYDLMRLDHRQIEEFHFWNNRLIILKQAFDQSRPATISQWWWDRRNGVQWYTFWVAIVVLFLTIFFGMAQSVEGALQVYKAFHPS
ncbi:hypothetical protein MHUMG1_10044 [Metarhizium humberi]|uniref:Uncharacterized protein n=1 Tax=Metarhizium humberi TaxID=2596975 RepID=A0A9P8S3H6_9HYPO|nr:hypothetical protein MHUMG1_10044 [Metarhizium humberi]